MKKWVCVCVRELVPKVDRTAVKKKTYKNATGGNCHIQIVGGGAGGFHGVDPDDAVLVHERSA